MQGLVLRAEPMPVVLGLVQEAVATQSRYGSLCLIGRNYHHQDRHLWQP
jgi:hypothetical protein